MLQMPETAKTFDLEFPVALKGTEYDKLNARRPKVKDLRVLSKGDFEKDPVGSFNNFLAGILSVPVPVIEELEIPDYEMIRDWVNDFLPKSAEATS